MLLGTETSLQMPGSSHSYLTVMQYFNVVDVLKCGVFLLNKDNDKCFSCWPHLSQED